MNTSQEDQQPHEVQAQILDVGQERHAARLNDLRLALEAANRGEFATKEDVAFVLAKYDIR